MKKYESLLEIPMGSKAKLTEASQDRFGGEWQVGTVVFRGAPKEYIRYTADDQHSVSFTFPDGDYHYLESEDFELISSEQSLEDRVKTLEQSVQALQAQLNSEYKLKFDMNSQGQFEVKGLTVGNSDSLLATHLGVLNCNIEPTAPIYKHPYPRFAHIRNKYEDQGCTLNHNKGGLTIAYQELADGSFNIGIALCSANDNFARNVGRFIAEERLIASPYNMIADGMKSILECIEDVRDFYSFEEWDHTGPDYISDRLVEGCIVDSVSWW